MYIYATHANTSVAVCAKHRELAEEQGWALLEYRARLPDWDCYFANRNED